MERFSEGLRLVSWLILIIPVLFLNVGMASAAEKPVKIGVVDLQKSLNDSQAGQKAKKSLTELITAKQKSVDGKASEIEKLRMELDKQSTVLSPEAKKQKEEKLERDMRDYQRMVKDTQEELQKKESELTTSIIKELRQIVKKIGDDEGYTIIFEQVEGIILYASSEYDLTERVIKTFDNAQKK